MHGSKRKRGTPGEGKSGRTKVLLGQPGPMKQVKQFKVVSGGGKTSTS